MVKKVLTLALGLMMSFGVMAQYSNPVVPQSDIQFWTGTGSNRAVIAVTWNDATAGNIGIAWGVQWNGDNVSVADLMDTIATYDANFIITHGNTTYTLINNLTYINTELGLNLVGPEGWWWYNWTAADGSNVTPLGWFYKHCCVSIFGNNEYASLMYAICYVALFLLMALWLYRKKIIIKL